MQGLVVLRDVTILINQLEAEELPIYINLFLSTDIYHPPGCNPAPGSDRIPVKVNTVYQIGHACILLFRLLELLPASHPPDKVNTFTLID